MIHAEEVIDSDEYSDDSLIINFQHLNVEVTNVNSGCTVNKKKQSKVHEIKRRIRFKDRTIIKKSTKNKERTIVKKCTKSKERTSKHKADKCTIQKAT